MRSLGRWSTRKRAILAKIDSRIITAEEAMDMHEMTAEELNEWRDTDCRATGRE